MAIAIKLVFGCIITIACFGCYSSKETIVLCNNTYDVYKNTEYNHEQKLTTTFNVLCFHRTNIIAFAYQISGERNDSNFVSNRLTQRNDTVIITTIYDSTVFNYKHETQRYFKCIENGFISLNSNLEITKKTKQKNRLKRKSMR